MRKNTILDDKYYTAAPLEADDAFERSVEIPADFPPLPDDLASVADAM
jgi:hypothetical protein